MSTVCYVDFENLYNSLEKNYGLRLTAKGYEKFKGYLMKEFNIKKPSNIRLIAVWDNFQHLKQTFTSLNLELIDSVVNARNSSDGKMMVEVITTSEDFEEVIIVSGDSIFLHSALFLKGEKDKKVSFIALKLSCFDKFSDYHFSVKLLDDVFDIYGYQQSKDEDSFEEVNPISKDIEVLLHKVVHMMRALDLSELAWIGVAHGVKEMREKQSKTDPPFNNIVNIIKIIEEACKHGIFIKGKQPHHSNSGTQDTLKLNKANRDVIAMEKNVDIELRKRV